VTNISLSSLSLFLCIIVRALPSACGWRASFSPSVWTVGGFSAHLSVCECGRLSLLSLSLYVWSLSSLHLRVFSLRVGVSLSLSLALACGRLSLSLCLCGVGWRASLWSLSLFLCVGGGRGGRLSLSLLSLFVRLGGSLSLFVCKAPLSSLSCNVLMASLHVVSPCVCVLEGGRDRVTLLCACTWLFESLLSPGHRSRTSARIPAQQTGRGRTRVQQHRRGTREVFPGALVRPLLFWRLYWVFS
jgi:hypothetical protein